MRGATPWFALFIVISCAPTILNSQTSSKTFKLTDATVVHIALQDTLSSTSNKADDPVPFEVTQDVKVGDCVVIAKGSIAGGHIVEAKSKTILGRSGKLDFTVDRVKASDGTDVRLRASSSRNAENPNDSLLLAPFNLILGGKDANITKGTKFEAYVDGDHEVSLASPKHAEDPAPAAQPVPPPAAPEPSTVVVKSTPDGADITVDGKFVGSTPSTLQLAPGDHAIVIEKPNYRQWQRTMSVNSGGIITVDAQLVAQ
jgi:hypothetical protein